MRGSKQDLPVAFDGGAVVIRQADWSDLTVVDRVLPRGARHRRRSSAACRTTAASARTGARRSAGRCVVRYRRPRGDATAPATPTTPPPGHLPLSCAGTEVVEFSPTRRVHADDGRRRRATSPRCRRRGDPTTAATGDRVEPSRRARGPVRRASSRPATPRRGCSRPDVFCDFTMPHWRLQVAGGRRGRRRCAGRPPGARPGAALALRPDADRLRRSRSRSAGTTDGDSWYCREMFRADVGRRRDRRALGLLHRRLGRGHRRPPRPGGRAAPAVTAAARPGAVLGDDAPEPGHERGRVAQVVEVQVGLEEGLLRRIAGQLDVAEPAQREPDRQALEPRDDAGERGLVAALGRADERGDVVPVRRGRGCAHVYMAPVRGVAVTGAGDPSTMLSTRPGT